MSDRAWGARIRLVVPASGRIYGWIPEGILGLGVPYVISGIGVAMGNAPAKVKNAADFVTKTNDQRGGPGY
ncbi:HAD hydrolase family protein [Lachnospiraceae bacterium 54-53]